MVSNIAVCIYILEYIAVIACHLFQNSVPITRAVDQAKPIDIEADPVRG